MMSSLRRLSAGIQPIAAIVDQGSISGSNFILLVLLGRNCSASQVAVYALGAAVIPLLTSLLDSLVAGPYVVYRALRHDRQAEFRGAVLIHALCISTTIALAVACLSLLPFAHHDALAATAVLAVALIAVPIVLRDLSRRLAICDHTPLVSCFISLLAALTQTITAWALAEADRLTGLSALLAIGSGATVASVYYLYRARREFAFSLREIVSAWDNNFKLGKWIVIAQALLMIYFALPQWIVGVKMNAAQTASLAASLSIVMIGNTALTGIGNFMIARASSIMHRDGPRQARRVLLRGSFSCAVFASLLMLFAAAYGPLALKLLYRGKFTLGTPLLVTLAGALVTRSLSLGSQIGCWIIQRPKISIATNALAIFLLLAISICLMPSLGLLGLAYAIVFSEGSAALIRWRQLSIVINQMEPSLLGVLSEDLAV